MEVARKHSKKREAILDAIKGTTDHPNAEMLYSQLKPEYPDLSLGTVYRNLGVLTKDRLIMSLGSVSGQERYDGNTAPHAHYICSACGRVVDIDFPDLPAGHYEAVERSTAGVVLGYFLAFFGHCADCCDKEA